MQKKYNILSLLPYMECSQLTNRSQKLGELYFIKSVIDICMLGLENFIDEKLILFDAQVGENLCQIRAFKIIWLADAYLGSLDAKREIINETCRIKNYRNKLEEVIVRWENSVSHACSYNKDLDSRESMAAFIDSNDLGLDLREDCLFIITSFFLAHFCYREDGLPVAMNLNFISRELHISKYKAKRLIHKLQVLICELGCRAILIAAEYMPSKLEYVNVLGKLYQISDEGRAVLPCFMTSEVIFNYSIKKKIPIFFIVNRLDESRAIIEDSVYFIFVGNNNSELELVPVDNYLTGHCIVVFGVMQLNETIANNSIIDYIKTVLIETPLKLILANTASHPQYAGTQLEHLKDNPFLSMETCYDDNIESYQTQLMQMREYAFNNGCSKENQSMFFLRHVYASKVCDEINRLKEIHTKCVYDATVFLS